MTATNDAVLAIRDLSVQFPSEAGVVRAVRNVSLDIRKGEVLGIVGESGSGKTVTSLSMIGLLPDSASIEGSITFEGKNLLQLSDDEMSKHRGRDISMVFQDPLSALNPVHTIGAQIIEALQIHNEMSDEAALTRAIELLEAVDLKILKAKNVEHADVVEGLGALEREVDLGDDPLEQMRVQRHRQRVARVGSLSGRGKKKKCWQYFSKGHIHLFLLPINIFFPLSLPLFLFFLS